MAWSPIRFLGLLTREVQRCEGYGETGNNCGNKFNTSNRLCGTLIAPAMKYSFLFWIGRSGTVIFRHIIFQASQLQAFHRPLRTLRPAPMRRGPLACGSWSPFGGDHRYHLLGPFMVVSWHHTLKRHWKGIVFASHIAKDWLTYICVCIYIYIYMVLWHLIANIGRDVTRHVGIRWEGGSSPPSQDRLKRVLTSTPSSTAQDLEAKSCSTYGWTCCIAEVYIYDIMLYKSIRLYACIQAIFDTFVETGKL